MPGRAGKKTVEIPQSLWEALDQAAKRQDMPTGAMVAVWLWEALEAKARIPGSPAEGLHAPQPYHQRAIYPRRGDGGMGSDYAAVMAELEARAATSSDHSQQAYDAKLEEHARFIVNERGE